MITVRPQDQIEAGPASRESRVRPTYLTNQVLTRAAQNSEQRIIARIEKKRG